MSLSPSFLSKIANDLPMFPSTDVLLSALVQRMNFAFKNSHSLATISSKVVFKSPSRISRFFPTIKLQVAHSPSHIYNIEALLDSGATATYIGYVGFADP